MKDTSVIAASYMSVGLFVCLVNVREYVLVSCLLWSTLLVSTICIFLGLNGFIKSNISDIKEQKKHCESIFR